MPTIAVAGCSFSDHTCVKKVYGEHLAELIGYNYLHLARGGGSNQRSIFISAKAIMDQKLVAGDIIILQYTDPHRKLMSSFPPEHYTDEPGNVEKWDTPYGTAWSTDYKYGSQQWQSMPENKNLHQALQDYAINNELETERMVVDHVMFEALCKQHNITLIPLHTRYISYIDTSVRPHDQNDIKGHIRQRYSSITQSRVFDETQFIKRGTAENPKPYDLGWGEYDNNGSTAYDNSHLSKKGHRYLAELLEKHLIGHKIVSNT